MSIPPARNEDVVLSRSAVQTKRLWHNFAEGVRAFVRRRVPASAAEDVVQDIFLRVHEGAAQLRQESQAQAWIYTIARRAIADFYRRRERRPDVEMRGLLSLEVEDEGALLEHLAAYDGAHGVHEEVLSWLRPMINALPESYAQPLRWADVEGFTQQEVADRLGLSLSGAKSRVQRARQKLGEVLAACCAVEFGADGRAESFRRLDKEKENECCD